MYGIINYDNAISMVSLESRAPVVFPNTASKHVTEMNVYMTSIKKFRKKHTIWKLNICLYFPMSDYIIALTHIILKYLRYVNTNIHICKL